MDFESAHEFTTIESLFVRRRNVLMLRGHFPGLYTDYYLHLMQHGLRYPQALDLAMKELLAGLALHLVARPWAETIAWTVNLRAPRVNFFATGASLQEQLAGRLFTEDVREPARSLFYQQVTVQDREPRFSTIEVEGTDPLAWVETLYAQSEQRPGRMFRLPDETFVLLAAQPDFDPEWLPGLDARDVAEIERTEETKLLETRRFKWDCGCTLDRVLPALGMWRDKPDELFQGEPLITIQCPRCAAKYQVTRDMI